MSRDIKKQQTQNPKPKRKRRQKTNVRLKRIQKEIKEITSNNSSNVSVGPATDDSGNIVNMFKWDATIVGPSGTPYEGGLFRLNIDIGEEYPFKPPSVRFVTKIYHCNVNKKGEICLDILKDNWSPALSIDKVLQSICSLMNEPNADDPLVQDIAKIYKKNKKMHDREAQEWTRKYAA